jgi:hypothetical protein
MVCFSKVWGGGGGGGGWFFFFKKFLLRDLRCVWGEGRARGKRQYNFCDLLQSFTSLERRRTTMSMHVALAHACGG